MSIVVYKGSRATCSEYHDYFADTLTFMKRAAEILGLMRVL